MRKLGLHLRLETTLVDLINKALRFNVNFFQCFLTLKTAGRVVPLHSNDIKEFIELRREHFKELYLHISYWVNLSTIVYNPHLLLKKELALAKKLEFTHLIFHPGSCKGTRNKSKGIDALAKMLNDMIKKEPQFVFVLENVAQSFPAIGGDLCDFKMLMEKIDKPEHIQFCIDTAHAYSFGHDLSNEKKQDKYIQYIDETVGLDRLCLIHANDTREKVGSHVDRHETIGDGNIGIEQLKRFVMHPKLKHIPLLTEPPILSDDELKAEFKKIVDWNK